MEDSCLSAENKLARVSVMEEISDVLTLGCRLYHHTKCSKQVGASKRCQCTAAVQKSGSNQRNKQLVCSRERKDSEVPIQHHQQLTG